MARFPSKNHPSHSTNPDNSEILALEKPRSPGRRKQEKGWRGRASGCKSSQATQDAVQREIKRIKVKVIRHLEVPYSIWNEFRVELAVI